MLTISLLCSLLQSLGGCPVYDPVLSSNAFSNLVSQCDKSTTYEAIAIAFVIAFAAALFTMVGMVFAIQSKYGQGTFNPRPGIPSSAC